MSISLGSMKGKNVMKLNKLITALFLVRYNDKYYADAIASANFTKLGLSLLLLSTCFGFSNFINQIRFTNKYYLLDHMLVILDSDF